MFLHAINHSWDEIPDVELKREYRAHFAKCAGIVLKSDLMWLPTDLYNWIEQSIDDPVALKCVYNGQACKGCGQRFMVLRRCSRCKTHRMCSYACQMQAWRTLKAECKSIAAKLDARPA